MSICIEQESYKNNQFSKYCSNFDNYSLGTKSKSTKWDLIGLFKLWKSRIRQRKALAKLDQRLLEDIGFNHEQVKQEIAKPFWK